MLICEKNFLNHFLYWEIFTQTDESFKKLILSFIQKTKHLILRAGAFVWL
jgi:hypothetical protein